MDNNILRIFIPAFMVVFVATISAWAEIRKKRSVKFKTNSRKSIPAEIKLVDLFFKILMSLSIAIAVVYSFYPEYYYIVGPIDFLDTPIVNTVGVLILKISLIWIVMAQFNIERTIAMINAGDEHFDLNKLVYYSQKLLLTGMLIMFLGFFITISSIVAILICVCAAILFERLRTSSSSNFT